MKKALVVSLLSLGLLVGCGGGNNSSESTSSSVVESSSSSLIESSSSIEEASSSSSSESSSISSEEEVNQTIISFYPLNESAGFGYHDNIETFDAYFPDGFLTSSSELTSIYAQKYNSNEDDVKLTISSRSNEGSITLHLTNAVSSLIIKGSDYHNYYSYTGGEGYNYDEAIISVNGAGQEFSHVANYGDTPTTGELRYDLSSPTNEIEISTSASTSTYAGNRCFIESLTFVF